MISIAKERLQWLMRISSRDEIDDIGGDEIRELARFALASLNSRPVASCIVDDGSMCIDGFGEYAEHSLPDGAHDLYAVPPLSVLPEQVPETLRDEIIDLCDGYEVGDIGAQEIWDVCRATMLSGVKP
ncbi:Uncharacterised protein [Citrobacter werkmanii]|uniref:DUF551 domain-containing protein n=1 Tax=Citrobacter werkmanii TaxID=67827 RepID=A0A9N8CVX6_9ENTR|nr:hypothetical protein [Citrobacter werkmanii]CAB5549857.1 Uncharacterised protein [Citrobacter werkmanii]CAB5577953.1 Uncharacterised protein [Citrobacter werkmanii]CAB5591624.1 Uncharacterised protein [Citrobacter werkmanii]CAB5591664.1 Uncharacterised protein [Citrobacter werkmanii]CAB5591952.1 Uncharacterised protein [Citrobacter werkmanii]